MHPDLLDPTKREKRRREADTFLALFDLMEPEEQERIMAKIDEIFAERDKKDK